MQPRWRTELWTDESMRELAARDFPWFMRTWDAYPSGVQRADAFRYMVMYSVGGVYADLDFELLRPMAPHMMFLESSPSSCSRCDALLSWVQRNVGAIAEELQLVR